MSKSFRITRERMQKIIDDFMTEAGVDIFRPGDFLDYVEARPKHPAWPILFAAGDADHARKHRLQLVRRMISGLRGEVIDIETVEHETIIETVQITESEVPATQVPKYVSIRGDRPNGGGYTKTDINNPAHRRELAAQAADELVAFASRHGGICAINGIDITGIENVKNALRAKSRVA